MKKQLDLRGQSCPLPVINSKKAVKAGDFNSLEILVDNDIARDNVVRALKKQECKIESVTEQGSDFLIIVSSLDSSSSSEKSGTLADFIDSDLPADNNRDISKQMHLPKSNKKAIFISKDTIGSGSDVLGALLMKAHLFTLTEMEEKPLSILLMNSGINLALEGNPCLANLQLLNEQGVKILVCGTCLDFFKLKEKCRVGSISNMYDITEAMFEADNTITI